jgi:hypothetical protein
MPENEVIRREAAARYGDEIKSVEPQTAPYPDLLRQTVADKKTLCQLAGGLQKGLDIGLPDCSKSC